MQRAAAETRRRTQAFVNLPADEGVELQTVSDEIFTPEETEQWLAEHIYPEAGIEPDTIDIAKLREAGELLEVIGGNAAFLLHEGRSDEEVKQFLIKYALIPDEEALKFLEFLKVPFQEAYIFTYFYGRQLMKPWLQGPDRLSAFRRFLTEQVYPSELVKEATS